MAEQKQTKETKTPVVDKKAFVDRKLAVMSKKFGAKFKDNAVRINNNNK